MFLYLFHKVDLDAIFANFSVDRSGTADAYHPDLPGQRIVNIHGIMPHHGYFFVPIAQLVDSVPSPVRAVELKDTFVPQVKVNSGEQGVGTRLGLPVMVIEQQMAYLIFTDQPGFRMERVITPEQEEGNKQD